MRGGGAYVVNGLPRVKFLKFLQGVIRKESGISWPIRNLIQHITSSKGIPIINSTCECTHVSRTSVEKIGAFCTFYMICENITICYVKQSQNLSPELQTGKSPWQFDRERFCRLCHHSPLLTLKLTWSKHIPSMSVSDCWQSRERDRQSFLAVSK